MQLLNGTRSLNAAIKWGQKSKCSYLMGLEVLTELFNGLEV